MIKSSPSAATTIASARPARSAATRRRGFTVLELALATFIGAVVVLTGIAVINSMFSTDATLDRRFTEVSEVERTRRIIQRSLTMLVMSDQPKPADSDRVNGNARTSGRSSSSSSTGNTSGSNSGGTTPEAGTTASSTSSSTGSRTLAPARFELAISTDPQLVNAVSAMRNDGSNQAAVQTLEIVCTRPPVPSGRPMWLIAQDTAQGDATVERDVAVAEEADTKSLPKAARGRFEMLPASDRFGNFWELWWHPLPPLDNDGAILAAYADPLKAEQLLGTPMRLCSHITELKWSAFDDAENKTALSAIWPTDLPAYVRLELKTRAGLYADWLFEVDFSTGAESGSNTQDVATDQGGGGGGGGGGAEGGGRGGREGGGRGGRGNGGGEGGQGAGGQGGGKDHSGGPTIKRVPRNPKSQPGGGGGGGGGGGDGRGGGQ